MKRRHALFAMVWGILLLPSIFSQTVSNSPITGPLVDGSKTPQLIPDHEMLALLFLTATAPTQGAREIETRRAKAFLQNLSMTPEDVRAFEACAVDYRLMRETPNATSSQDEAFQHRIALATNAMSRLRTELSPAGWATLASLLKQEKRSVKLFPIPPMKHHAAQAPNWWNQLLAYLRPRTVYAQGMTPYASLYTSMSVDDGDAPTIYATGTTNAQSGCNCHDVSVYTTLTLPGGRMDGDTRYGYYEVAQATVALTLTGSDSDGFMQASSTHNAYCPINQTQFVSGEQTSQSNPLQKTRAYYKCVSLNNGQCVKQPHPFFPAIQVYTHDRCNSGTICNRLWSRNNNWLFTLQTVWQISIGGNTTCSAVPPPDAQQRIACASPDPIP